MGDDIKLFGGDPRLHGCTGHIQDLTGHPAGMPHALDGLAILDVPQALGRSRLTIAGIVSRIASDTDRRGDNKPFCTRGRDTAATASVDRITRSMGIWHFLYFLPLPQ